MFSKPDAQKVRNLRANPSVMLALGDAEDDFDVGLVEGRAELLERPTGDVLPAGHLAKYAARLRRDRPHAPRPTRRPTRRSIRIVPADFLRWHGRTTPHSVRLIGAPAVSIDETAGQSSGEPMSRRRSRSRGPASSGPSEVSGHVGRAGRVKRSSAGCAG